MNFQALKSVKLNSLLLMGALSIGLLACNKESESPRPMALVDMQFNTVKTEGSLAQRGAPNTVQFDSGYITLRRLEFEGETDGDSTEVEFELEGDVLLDFATGTTTPDISAISFPAGTYREIDVEIELGEQVGKPGISLNGSFTDALGLVHPVRFEFNSNETFEVEKEGLYTFADKQNVLTMVTFDPVAWFAKVSSEQLSNATKDSAGVIVVSSTQNRNIYDTVADGLDLASEVEISN